MGKRIEILETDQTCALGAAIYGAVAGGAYANVQTAAAKCIEEFLPNVERAEAYRRRYEKYLQLAERETEMR